ncbi:MAG: antitoxin MazE family protein [Acetobacteraceae bacterium]|nr:antitoxin MazE family protein [Acetobacteraceae bacterium]
MGLRPIQIWVPDTRAPGFAAEAKRQSELVGRSPESRETQEWIDDNGPLADERPD